MALPEQQPEVPVDQQVVEIPQAPEIPPAVEQAGVQTTPSQVQPVQDDNGKTIAQPVPAPPAPDGPTVTVPAPDQTVLKQMTKGNISNSQTWFGVFWIKKIKMAIKDGISVVFKKG